MPLRKYKIQGFRSRVSPETGEEVVYVDLELQDIVSIRFKSPDQLKNVEIYKALIGETISLMVREGEMNGQAWTNFTGDGMPVVNMDARTFLKNRHSDSAPSDLVNHDLTHDDKPMNSQLKPVSAIQQKDETPQPINDDAKVKPASLFRSAIGG